MRVRSRNHRRTGIVVIAFVVFAVVIGVMIQRKYAERHQKPVAPPHGQQAAAVVTLYFAAPEGGGLVSEGRSIDPCGDAAECIDTLVAELVAGPVGDLEPALPSTLQLRDVTVASDTAVLDFSHDLVDGLPGGSSAEMAAVYSVVNTVCANLPQVKRVRFLVDGRPLTTLKGHLDLHEPLGPDYTLEQKEPAAAGTTNDKGGQR